MASASGQIPTPRRRGPSRALTIGLGVAGVATLVALGAAWVAWTGVSARDHLTAAKSALPGVQRAWLAGDESGGDAALVAVQRDADAAYGRTHDPVWTVASWIPLLGDPIRTTRGLTAIVQDVVRTSLPALAPAAGLARPAQLVTGPGTIDVARLAGAAGSLQVAADSLGQDRDAVAALSPSWLPAVAQARQSLLDELIPVASTARTAASAATVLPPMLGAGGPRRYFVGFQNPAELRGTGGLLDAFAILVADHGRISVQQVGSNAQLPGLPAQIPGLDPGYVERYAGQGALGLWVDSNLSPDFAEVGRAWAAMWAASTGQQVDGAIALDPSALAQILAATGPVSVPGLGSVGADAIGPLVLAGQYQLSDVVAQRKSVMLEVGNATMSALLAGRGDRATLVSGLTHAATTGHLLVYSGTSDEEAILDSSGIAGTVPRTAAPFAESVVVNAAGSKLDTYLDSATTYRVTRCTTTARDVTVSVTLTNRAPSGLPAYVTHRDDEPTPPPPPGQNRVNLQVLLTQSSAVSGATLDGVALPLSPPTGQLPATLSGPDLGFLDQGVQVGRPSYGLELELPVGRPRTLTLQVTEPPSSLAPLIRVQPSARPSTTTVEAPACS